MATKGNIYTTMEPSVKREDEEEATQLADNTTGDKLYLSGWRLHGSTAAVLLGLFLVNMEVSIVGTALVSITSDLHGFDESGWVITAFLSTYTGFIILWSKLSDFVGRRNATLASLSIFVAFSGGCGGASTMLQLLICRAFQGVGAAGVYSICVLIIYDLVPRTKLPVYAAITAFVVAFATAMGPLLGGSIAQGSATWRWIFYVNIPFGVLGILLLFFSMPSTFPELDPYKSVHALNSKGLLTRLDTIGAFLLLSGTILLVVALFEGPRGSAGSWSTPRVIVLFIFSGISFILFMFWERHITISSKAGATEPMFPSRFLRNKAWSVMLMISFAVGFPFNVLVVTLPQRNQLVTGASPFEAGVRLLPYVLSASVSAILANLLTSKLKAPFMVVFILGGIIQFIGLILLATTIPDLTNVPTTYLEETLCGIGIGVVFSILMLATPFVCDKRDLGT